MESDSSSLIDRYESPDILHINMVVGYVVL